MYYLNDDIKKDNAMILIITGDTLQEASQKTGLSIGKVKRLSTRENLQHKRKAFKREVYNEDWKRLRTVQRKMTKLTDMILSFTGREKEATKEFLKGLELNNQIKKLIF